MMYILYLLFFVTYCAICADLPIISPSRLLASSLTIPSTPPQDIKGRHHRKVSLVLTQKSSCVQEIKKDSPLKASQDDEDLIEAMADELAAPNGSDTEDEPIFKMDE